MINIERIAAQMRAENKVDELFDIRYTPHLTRIMFQNVMEIWSPVFENLTMKQVLTIGYVHWFAVKELQNEFNLKANPEAVTRSTAPFTVADCQKELNARWKGVIDFNRSFVVRTFATFLKNDFIVEVENADRRSKAYRASSLMKEQSAAVYARVSLSANLIAAQRAHEQSRQHVSGLQHLINEVLGVAPDVNPHSGRLTRLHGQNIQPQPLRLVEEFIPSMDGPDV